MKPSLKITENCTFEVRSFRAGTKDQFSSAEGMKKWKIRNEELNLKKENIKKIYYTKFVNPSQTFQTETLIENVS
jgi:hypothetical protein